MSTDSTLTLTAPRDLAARPAVQRALDWATRHADWALNQAIQIAEIPAPTFAEAKRAEHVATRFRELGLSAVEIDAIGNVYGCRLGVRPGPAIALCAHTDTVFPVDAEVATRRDGGRIWGPGLGDNSLGVAGLMALARALDEGGVRTDGPIWCVATVGEEGLGDLRGMREAMRRLGPALTAAVAVEGAGLGRIYHAGIGVRRLRITFRAPGGHSWLHFGARSAVHELMRFGARLADLEAPRDPKTTFNIGVIEGGTTVNSIAQSASLLLDLRSESIDALDVIVGKVDTTLKPFRRLNDLEVHVDVVGDRPAGRLPTDHPFVLAARQAADVAGLPKLGIRPQFEAGSTDANIPLSLGLPAVCVGVTTGGNNHRLDEFIDVAPIPTGLRHLILLALTVTGVAIDA